MDLVLRGWVDGQAVAFGKGLLAFTGGLLAFACCLLAFGGCFLASCRDLLALDYCLLAIGVFLTRGGSGAMPNSARKAKMFRF
ncbi:Zn-dependent peptidases [Bacillus sp. OxB-1]|nr:Zn-dependent peptidases [Bacillus sp. OxB-1]